MISPRRFAPPVTALLPCVLAALPAAAQAVPDGQGSAASLIARSVAHVRDHLRQVATAIPGLPGDLEQVGTTLGREGGGAAALALGIVLALVAGFALEWLFRRATAGPRRRRAAAPIAKLSDRLVRVAMDALLDVVAVLAFGLGGLVVLATMGYPARIHEATVALLTALVYSRLAAAILNVLLRPQAGPSRDLACFDLDSGRAGFWYNRLLAFVAWFAMGWSVIAALRVLGMPRGGLLLLAYVLGLGLVALAIAMVWHPRPPATEPAAPEGVTAGNAGSWLATLLVVLFWIVWTVGAMPLFWFMTAAVGLPLTIGASRRAARHLLRPVPGPDGSPGMPSVVAVLVEQGLRAVLIVGAIGILLWGWGLDVGALAGQETTFTRVLRGFLHALIIVLVADLGWGVVRALSDNTLARAQAAPGLDPDEARRRARIRTLLPIGRNIAAIVLVVMAALMALSALGVEIGPLIASAGVVGVAVGFGAQTVVRDMISGMFYMLDDAFRVGEYIQSGSYKGTVESFSLRSVKLRHQRGPLFTIPFGVLGAVQNMSRDWVIVKDKIGITYDSDVDKAKKLIKQIGLELAKDPDLAPNILQPLKMQGIEEFGEYAINIRTKMMTKPGEQFVIRRRANAMIKKAFDENGIHFAFPTVQLAGGGGDANAAAAAVTAQNVLKPGAPAP